MCKIWYWCFVLYFVMYLDTNILEISICRLFSTQFDCCIIQSLIPTSLKFIISCSFIFFVFFCIDHCNKSNALKQVAILCSSEINTKYELEWLIVVCRYFLHYDNTHIYHRNSMYMLSGAPNFLLQLYVFVSVRHFCTLLYLSWGCFVTWGHTCICYIWYISLVYCCIFCTLHPSTLHLFDCCIIIICTMSNQSIL